MMPDVTNQADKEPGLLWTDAQLWVQLCSCCSERERKKEQEETEKRDGEGEEMLHCPKIIYLDQSVNIANTCIFSCPVKPNRLCQCISKCSFFFLFCSPLPFSLPPTLSLFLSLVGTGPAQHISKISCSDRSFSPNPAIMKSYATVASCRFGRYSTNQT